MNAPERILPDIQSEVDHRSIAIERVGVKSMKSISAYALIENRKG